MNRDCDMLDGTLDEPVGWPGQGEPPEPEPCLGYDNGCLCRSCEHRIEATWEELNMPWRLLGAWRLP